MSIVSYSGPGYYPPIVVDLINAAWDQGLNMQATFEAKVANATTGWLDTALAPVMASSSIAVPTVSEPSVTVPTSASVGDVLATFDAQYADLVTFLAGKFTDFRTAHFPDDDSNYSAAAAWIADALANPDQVLPTALADIIWEDDRSRILLDTARAGADVVATWAANGYPLPAGAEASAVLQLQQTSLQELAKSSRNVAVKTFEMAYDRLKFVVGTAISAQQAAMSAALDYIKALAVGPDISSRLVDAGYTAETRLVTAASAWYNARSDAVKVTMAANQFNATATQNAAEKNQASELALIHDRLTAMLEEARALAQMSTSLFNNAHVSAGVSASDSVSTSL
jgi:hypothetical protein